MILLLKLARSLFYIESAPYIKLQNALLMFMIELCMACENIAAS